MAKSNAERQKAWREKHQTGMVRVCISVPPGVAAEVRQLEKLLRDPDMRLVSVALQNSKTGRLASKRL